MTHLPRRTRYHASPFRSDYFVVRALTRFIDAALRAHVRRAAVVLDVGCGEQPWRGLVTELGGRYLGCDIRQNGASTATTLCAADALPFRGGTIDVALCTEVLEHVPDPEATLRQLRHILRPGAIAIVTTPFLYPLHEEPADFQRLTLHQVRRLAGTTGFAVDALEAAGNELEVFATHWDRLWSNGIPITAGVWRTVALAVLRWPANVLTAAASRLLGRWLPARAYLSTLAVLRVPAGAP